MIGKIKGTISEIHGNEGLVETASGLFYKVFLTPDLIRQSSGSSDSIALYTHLQVREDALTLYGFQNRELYDMFQTLLTVDKVGPKVAYTIISNASVDQIVQASLHNDVTFFSKIPGIGKKTAHKILLELTSKLGAEFNPQERQLTGDDVTVVDALAQLGYSKKEAMESLDSLDATLSVEAKITAAIRALSNPK